MIKLRDTPFVFVTGTEGSGTNRIMRLLESMGESFTSIGGSWASQGWEETSMEMNKLTELLWSASGTDLDMRVKLLEKINDISFDAAPGTILYRRTFPFGPIDRFPLIKDVGCIGSDAKIIVCMSNFLSCFNSLLRGHGRSEVDDVLYRALVGQQWLAEQLLAYTEKKNILFVNSDLLEFSSTREIQLTGIEEFLGISGGGLERAWCATMDTNEPCEIVDLDEIMASSPPDTREIMFVGMARSGNHAIINWVAAGLNEPDISFMNNIGDGNAKECCIGYGSVPLHKDPLNARVVTYSLEDKSKSTCFSYRPVNRENLTVVLIIRDPRNLHASRLMQMRAGKMPEKNVTISRNCWLNHCRWYGEDKSEATYKFVGILYDRWFVDKSYRDVIADELGFTNADVGVEFVPPQGQGSSFDRHDYQGRANEMPVLDRWRKLEGDPEFDSFLSPEVCEFMEELF